MIANSLILLKRLIFFGLRQTILNIKKIINMVKRIRSPIPF